MCHTILIVDDDAELRLIYTYSLRREGYTVVQASDGMEAMSQLNANTPTLIILDALMPNMNGAEFLNRLNLMPRRSDIRVIVLTAYPGFRRRIEDFEIDLFLAKPVLLSDLMRQIKNLLPPCD